MRLDLQVALSRMLAGSVGRSCGVSQPTEPNPSVCSLVAAIPQAARDSLEVLYLSLGGAPWRWRHTPAVRDGGLAASCAVFFARRAGSFGQCYW